MTGTMTAAQFEAKINSMHVPPPESDKENVHSGSDYAAVQLTCRQLIRTPRPITALRKNLEAAVSEASPEISNEMRCYLTEMAQVVKNIARISGDEEFAFFPFEIQVMDEQSWEVNSTGKASHGRYKKSQIRAARRRVLNEVLPLA